MMTTQEITAALKKRNGAIPREQFSEEQLPEAVRLLVNDVWDAAWEQGTNDGRDYAEQGGDTWD